MARREKVKLLIELSATMEEADKTIEEEYGFETEMEKIAFLKGMFDVEIFGCEYRNSSVKDSYWVMLDTIINQKYNS